MRAAGGTAIALTIAAMGMTGGCDGVPPGPASRPGVLLVTLDTFRADHLGCAGHPDVRTPHLDRLERRGVQWPHTVTAIPLTTPSHATLLTGRTPRSHGLVKNRMRLDGSVTTLAEDLAREGWRTGAIVSSGLVLGPEFGLDRGFATYQVIEPRARPGSGEGARTADAAVAWLRDEGGPGSFLWAHFFDPHLPYLPPEPLGRLYDPDYRGALNAASPLVQRELRTGPDPDPADVQHLMWRYAGELTFVDRCLGRVLRELEERHPATRIVVTADHGEGLYEHDRYFGHDTLLYETAVRVPLIATGLPGPFRARVPGRVCPDAARTVDVAPTLLGWCDVAIGEDMEGRDLLGEPPRSGDELQFVIETHPSETKALPSYALRTGEQKVILRPDRESEAYDLRSDPDERVDLWGKGLPLHRVLRDDLLLDLKHRPPRTGVTVDAERGGLDAATREALESLGYVDR